MGSYMAVDVRGMTPIPISFPAESLWLVDGGPIRDFIPQSFKHCCRIHCKNGRNLLAIPAAKSFLQSLYMHISRH